MRIRWTALPALLLLAACQDPLQETAVNAVPTPPLELAAGVTIGNAPPAFEAPTPPHGFQFAIPMGAPFAFPVQARDPDAGDVVSIGITGVPAGASVASVPGNPGTATFSWPAPPRGSAVLTLTATDKGGLQAPAVTVLIDVYDPALNRQPAWIPPTPGFGQVFNIAVGQPIHLQVSAVDPDGDPVTITLTGAPAGATVTSAPNPGNPANVLIDWTPTAPQTGVQFRISARDNRGASNGEQGFTINVNSEQQPPPPPGNRAPLLSSLTGGTADEGQSITFNAVASDPDGDPLTYRWNFGDGATAVTNAPTVAHLYLNNKLNPYEPWPVQLEVDDGKGGKAFMGTQADVRNVSPVIDPIPNATINLGQSYDLSLVFHDVGVQDMPWQVYVDWGDGTPPLQVERNAQGVPVLQAHGYTAPGTYRVHVKVREKFEVVGGAVAEFDVTVLSRPPQAQPGGPYAGVEGSPVAFHGSAFDPDGDAIVSYLWDFGDGSPPVAGQHPVHAYGDNGNYAVTLTVTDARGMTDTKPTSATIANAPPVVCPISSVLDPLPAGSPVGITAAFTDPGWLDTHTAQVDWGDGSTSAGTIGAGTAGGSHVYTSAGVYTVRLTVTDDDGGSGSSTFEYVVIYDPADGFVTGGGWFTSPAGAYALAPSQSGRATFGFVSKYLPGATVPSGNTEFQLHGGGFNFKSTSYDWLVVAGAKAMFHGTGTIDGGGAYRFQVTAWDGAAQGGGGGRDRFRIRIWGASGIVYDNEPGAAENADPTTALGGGSIVIHRQ